MVIPPEYSVKVQAQIPSALCAIHNFIRIHDPKEDKLPDLENSEYFSSIPNPGDDGVRQMDYTENDISDDVAFRRDKIAQDMWDSYQRVLQARNEEEGGNEDDEDDEDEGDNFIEEMFYDDENFIIT